MNNKEVIQLCREMRQNPTKAESAMWEIVRRRQFLGLKFYRQYPIFLMENERRRFLITDFFCHEKKLVLELDGGIHSRQKEYDDIRDSVLEELGLKVIRIKNEELLNNKKETILYLVNQVETI